jgi:hypothetical protein
MWDLCSYLWQMVQVFDHLCAEGLGQFITGFTLSAFCGRLQWPSIEDCELLLRNSQLVISSNSVAV